MEVDVRIHPDKLRSPCVAMFMSRILPYLRARIQLPGRLIVYSVEGIVYLRFTGDREAFFQEFQDVLSELFIDPLRAASCIVIE